MSKKLLRNFGLTALTAATLAACGTAEPPGGVPEPGPTSDITVTPSISPDPSPTGSVTPEPTPSVSITPDPSPTGSITPEPTTSPGVTNRPVLPTSGVGVIDTTVPSTTVTLVPSQMPGQCSAQAWNASQTYSNAGTTVAHNGKEWRNQWWSNPGEEPGVDGVWTLVRECPSSGVTQVPTTIVTQVPTTTNIPPIGADHSMCRPAGLWSAPGVNSPYCTVYDGNGRERLPNGLNRRIIGYFTSWRNGANGMPTYLAADVPWESISHINYAFGHVGADWEVSIGNPNDPNNAATSMTWDHLGPNYYMDEKWSFKGHFNLLNSYAKQHGVKLLVALGGWAETGGYWGEGRNGIPVDEIGRNFNGGFYALTNDVDTGAVRHDRIATFAKSAVDFLRTYDFDGIDIDYEYPTSMSDAGMPEDWSISNRHRGELWEGYMALMEALRVELDKAGEEDGVHYLLTIASPSSGYLLRGFEGFQALKYLDFVNIMSYDLHGAWNHFVGHNAPLFDTGLDNEIKDAGLYDISQTASNLDDYSDGWFFGQMGYLNIDWAYRYFLTAIQGGRVNIGLPYYTRGWQDVQGGINGLWGLAARPDQQNCYLGTGGNLGPDALSEEAGAPCGLGAEGIDNLWFDVDGNGNEMFAGAGPIWHANNLRDGLPTPYVASFGHDVDNNPKAVVRGSYTEYYDEVAQASWLWNPTTNVFLSTENERSYRAKVQYAIDQGAGGIMFWELAGDYSRPGENGRDYYWFGSTLTDIAADMLRAAPPYSVVMGDDSVPTLNDRIDMDIDLVGFSPVGEENYPIQIGLKLTNNSSLDLTGASIRFSVSSAVPITNLHTGQNSENINLLHPYEGLNDFSRRPGVVNSLPAAGWEDGRGHWSVVRFANGSGATEGNVGGLPTDFHRLQFDLIEQSNWGGGGSAIPFRAGQTITLPLRIYMPMPVPAASSFEVELADGRVFGVNP